MWGALGLCTVLLLVVTYVPGLSVVLKTVDPGVAGWGIITSMSSILGGGTDMEFSQVVMLKEKLVNLCQHLRSQKDLYTSKVVVLLVMNMKPFEKEIAEMKRIIEHVEKEFRREIVHIKPLD